MPEPIITFDLTSGRGPKSFDSVADFDSWWSKQIQFWSGFPNLQGQNSDTYSRWQQLHQALLQQLNIVKRPDVQPAMQQTALQEISRLLKECYGPNGLVESESPEGLILSQYLQRDPNLAFGFLASVTSQTNIPQGKPIIFWSGFVLGSLNRVGMLKETQVDLDHLESVEKDWRERMETLSKEMADATSQSQSFLKDIQKNRNSQLEEIQKQNTAAQDEKEQREKEFSEQKTNFEERFEELRERYDRKLAFRAPVSYWTEKAKAHARAAIWWGVVWLVVGGGSVAAILLVIAPFLAPGSKIDYQHGALILLLSGFAIWLMRILTRMFLSSVHQHSDAGQRETMILTYIALEEEGKLTEEHRTMIIEAMFRPVTMGVVKEDETPSHPFGMISKLTGKD
jgi:Family of unknown function (DUF6161)